MQDPLANSSYAGLFFLCLLAPVLFRVLERYQVVLSVWHVERPSEE